MKFSFFFIISTKLHIENKIIAYKAAVQARREFNFMFNTDIIYLFIYLFIYFAITLIICIKQSSYKKSLTQLSFITKLRIVGANSLMPLLKCKRGASNKYVK